MSKEYTQKELEVMVQGKPISPRAVFFEQAVLNHPESNRLNKRVYMKSVFIKLVAAGTTDWAAYKAQETDIAAYPEEYQYFLGNKQGVRAPSIEIIPNLDIIHYQELLDFGLLTIPALASAETVPEHLEYARKSAIAINKALQESHREQEIHEEEIPLKTIQNTGGSEPAVFMPTAGRRNDTVDVGQPAVPRGAKRQQESGTSQRLQTGGRINGDQGLSPNWEVEFTSH